MILIISTFWNILKVGKIRVEKKNIT